jgi:hypothetical protein
VKRLLLVLFMVVSSLSFAQTGTSRAKVSSSSGFTFNPNKFSAEGVFAAQSINDINGPMVGGSLIYRWYKNWHFGARVLNALSSVDQSAFKISAIQRYYFRRRTANVFTELSESYARSEKKIGVVTEARSMALFGLAIGSDYKISRHLSFGGYVGADVDVVNTEAIAKFASFIRLRL